MSQEQTHWKKLTNPDYLGAYSFAPKEEKILTIKQVKTELVVGTDGKKEQCTVARFMEAEKPMILNRTNCKIISKVYKTPYIEQWEGKTIQIYVAEVKAFGEMVDALRIRAIIPQKQTGNVVCEECAQAIKPAMGKTSQWIAEYTKSKYNKSLCSVCAEKAKKEMERKAEQQPNAPEAPPNAE